DMAGREGGSEIMSERGYNGGYADTLPSPASRSASTKKAAGHATQTEADEIPEEPATTKRKVWLAFVWLCTWLIPSFALTFCGRIKRRDQRIAWREKVALCLIIFWSCVFVIFWIVGLGLILCPRQHVYSSAELQSHNTDSDALISVRGEVFDIKDFSHMNVDFKYLVDRNYLGLDQSSTFPYQLSFVCPFPDLDPRLSFQPKPTLYSAGYYHDHRWWRHPTTTGYNYYQFRLMRLLRENHSKGHIAVDPKELQKEGNGNSKNAQGQNIRRCIIHDQIYDLSAYIDHGGAPYLISDTQNSTNSVDSRTFLDDAVFDMFDQNPGKDITEMWDRYFAGDAESHARHIQCLRGAFYVGKVDMRKSARCYAANYLLLAGSIALVAIIFFKFIAALQFGTRRDPEPSSNFVYFPYYKNKFVAAAKCMTNAPDQLSVLLSQRRRWINSTVHNLFELVFLPQLCGFCCFSMRFVVFIDLITTIIMPATLVYLAYLVYQLTNPDSTTSYISLYLLAAIYGMQALIFILKRQWQHIGWMIVYILAIPVFSFVIPIYSFWHFDDFSWGNTRMVVGESGRKHVYMVDNEKFDTSTIPMRKWSDYEMDLVEEQKSHYTPSESGSRFGGAAAVVNRPGSAIGNVPKSMAGYAQSNYGTNSVYYDNGYGYNTALNNSVPVNNPMFFGGNFDIPSSGRSSPMQPMMGNMTPNAFEMATLNQARMSQASGSPFAQPGIAMPDPRMSAAYSMVPVASSPGQQMQGAPAYPFPSVGSNSAGMIVSGPDMSMGQQREASTAIGSFGDFTLAPVSPPGAQQLSQWPSGISDEQLAGRVAEIIATTDLMTITKKQVRQQIMAYFGMSSDEEKARREHINQCITTELEMRQASA
ncbi:hypothetical protein GGH98_003139, partial [Coemansia sp. RSA 454]